MAATKQTIQDFYRVAQARDFSRDVQFRLLNMGVNGTDTTFDEDDFVYIRTASLPARGISPVQAKYMGLNFNLPGVATYPNSDNYTMQIYCDQNSFVRNKFMEWSRDIFDDNDSTGNYLTPKATSTIDLLQLDHNFLEKERYKLIGVSIRNVGDISYTIAEGTGTVATFNLTLAYHYWNKVDASGNISNYDMSAQDLTNKTTAAAT
jgi:hypothetical protein